jgi:hypothetical protein
MPRSSLGARSQISWVRDALVVVLPACYEMLEFWIEYAYLPGMKMSCCPVLASCALLNGPNYVSIEVVVICLTITQRTLVREREPRSVSQVRPCGRTVLKSGLRWSVTWWRGAAFCHHRPVDRWVLGGGIDRFSIAKLNHVYSSGFVVRISLRANPEDRVVIDGVLIDGCAGLLIRFIIAGWLTATWNVVVEFLRPQGNSKPIVIVHRSSCSWAGCSRSSSSPIVNDSVPNKNRMLIRNFSL